MSSYHNVADLLDRFDEIQAGNDNRKKRLYRFLFKLTDSLDHFHRKYMILSNCNFFLTGSSKEGTVVRDSADFDVILELPDPFTMDYLETSTAKNRCYEKGVFKLWCYQDTNTAEQQEFLTPTGYLNVTKLKEACFRELESAVNAVAGQEPNTTYTCQKKQSSFGVTIQSASSSIIRIDLVPQIAGNFRDLPDWNECVPDIVRHFMRSYRLHFHFNLSYPYWLESTPYENLAAYATFSLVENHCLQFSDNVKNAVRLTKAVSKHYQWTKKGLHSFHIKRIAISLYDTLHAMDPWDGYVAILSKLEKQLRNYFIWGFFMNSHNIIIKDEVTCFDLAEDIKQVRKDITPKNILKKLSEYV